MLKKMNKFQTILFFSISLMLFNCAPSTKLRYDEAFSIINKDFMNKDNSIKEFGKDISGILIYDSIYKNPLQNIDSENIHKNIISETKKTPTLRKDKNLEKIRNKNLNTNWDLNSNFNTVYDNVVLYDSVPNGPLKAALFTEIVDDKLRIDVVPFFVEKPKYCGSITKYYFKFNKNKIVETKKWTDHYECW